jgi:hypothetical protein
MSLLADKTSETLPGAPRDTGFLSLERLRHHCDHRGCPERGRLWPRWRRRTDEIAFESRRYCCASCAEPHFAREIERHLLLARQENERPHRVPLGLLLVSRGLITSAQLQEALFRQRERPALRLGSLLQAMGALSETALTAILGIQWGCPVFPLEANLAARECAGLLPFALQQSAGVLPVHHSSATKILHLAFTKRIDHTLLYAVERMCGCRAVPCVASDRLVTEALQRGHAPSLQETVFDSVRGANEMAHLAADYAANLRAARVQVAGAADHLWFRLENSRGEHDLLFHSPPQRHPAGAPSR